MVEKAEPKAGASRCRELRVLEVSVRAAKRVVQAAFELDLQRAKKPSAAGYGFDRCQSGFYHPREASFHPLTFTKSPYR
jgi:hypothetical protein